MLEGSRWFRGSSSCVTRESGPSGHHQEAILEAVSEETSSSSLSNKKSRYCSPQGRAHGDEKNSDSDCFFSPDATVAFSVGSSLGSFYSQSSSSEVSSPVVDAKPNNIVVVCDGNTSDLANSNDKPTNSIMAVSKSDSGLNSSYDCSLGASSDSKNLSGNDTMFTPSKGHQPDKQHDTTTNTSSSNADLSSIKMSLVGAKCKLEATPIVAFPGSSRSPSPRSVSAEDSSWAPVTSPVARTNSKPESLVVFDGRTSDNMDDSINNKNKDLESIEGSGLARTNIDGSKELDSKKEIGSRVYAQWENGEWYFGTITNKYKTDPRSEQFLYSVSACVGLCSL